MQFDSFPCELKNGIMPIVNLNRTKDSVELLKAEIENNNKHTIQHYKWFEREQGSYAILNYDYNQW